MDKETTRIVEIFAGGWDQLPDAYRIFLAFGFVMALAIGAAAIAGERAVALVCITTLLVVIILFVPNRQLFQLSADSRKLKKFMGAEHGLGGIRICLPQCDHTIRNDIYGESFSFVSLARSDVDAMLEILALLARHDLVGGARGPMEMLIAEENQLHGRIEAVIHIGGPRVSGFVDSVVRDDPVIAHELAEGSKEIAVTVKSGNDERYAMRPPTAERSDSDTFLEETFGCVMKRATGRPRRLFVWGLDARGTHAAANWLVANWARLKTKYGIGLDESFTAVLRVKGNARHADDPLRGDSDSPHPLLLPSKALH